MSGYELSSIPVGKQKVDEGGQQQDHIETPRVVILGKGSAKLPTLDVEGRPVDRFNIVFIVLLLHGVGTLMPWNMFINAEKYFRDYKLNPENVTSSEVDIDADGLSQLRKNFLSHLSVASQLPNVFFNGLNLIVNMGSGNPTLRVNLTLAIEALIFLLTIILAVVDSSKWPLTFFYVTMISVVGLNMASGVYQNCIFGTGAKFPSAYTNAILIGSNISGTFTSIVNLISIWLAPQPQEAAMYYFITALVVIMICLISYNLLPMNSFFRHYIEVSQNQNQVLEIGCEIPGTSLRVDENTNTDVPENMKKTVDAMVPRPVEKESENRNQSFIQELNNKFKIFKKCWPQCLNVFFTFYVTLALFPAVMADIKQLQGFFSENYFTPFSCFFMFNLFAMIGNLISGWTTWPGRKRVWILVALRFLFVPFFLFCNFRPSSRHWPILFRSDIAFIIGNMLLAISSGYLSSLTMMFASSNLESNEAPKAGMLAAFFLVFGIFLGIYSSFILAQLVEIG